MGLGFLTIQAHTGNDALPVSGATVIIRDSTGKILYDLTTNEVGSTEKISLFAPAKAHTLTPEDTGPFFATYQVDVMLPGKFITEIVHDVQIFDTIESILPVNMLPLPLNSEQLVDEIEIAAPAIGLPIKREQVGPPADPAPTPFAPFALREVVIPDFITVHLGHPSASARNVRVRFSDYIKNVASSEIYPTWPQAALEANILAQISFALNRVFTEWYRSRRSCF
ncbi:MAG: hypothetical protein FWC79_02415 [Oscillospiraceae bacterium]|nr:hypothetical protein [Oscillospiraceae bacterium]